jgi:hypothetical protein
MKKIDIQICRVIRKSLCFLGILSIIAISGCTGHYLCEHGSSKIINKDFNFDNFKRIVVNGSSNLFVSQGDSNYVRIETDDNIMPLVETNIEDGILYISNQRSICPTKFNIYATMREIEGLKLEGSGNIKAQTSIKTGKLLLTLAGSGNFSIPYLIADKVKAEILGSGNINLSGSAEKLYIEIAGSGDANCSEFVTNAVKIEIAGSGDCHVVANEELLVDITGSGDVFYAGNPSEFRTSVIGSGKIKPVK